MYDSFSEVSKPYRDWNQAPDITSSCSSNGGKQLSDFPKGHSRTIYLPAERTGAVIGKNGRMKHLIKEVCNVWMSIKSEPYELDNSKRVCVIRGPTSENLDHAQSLINELLRDRETIEKSISLDTSDDVGRVIGSGGSNIQIIKDKTGAFVYVDKENVSAQYAGRCIIRGNSVQVLAAEKRVVELLARRDMMLHDTSIRNNSSMHKLKIEKTENFTTSSSEPPQNQTPGEQSEIGVWNGSDNWSNQKEHDREQERNAKKRIQDTILIPLQAVGMVIGKKGKNIKIIQETSGANVYIDKEYQGSDDNALCVIHGKYEQVSIAKVMIKEKLNQYNSGVQVLNDDNGNGSPHGSTGSNNQINFMSSPNSSNSMLNSSANYFSRNNSLSSPSTPYKSNLVQHNAQQQNYFNFNIDHNNNIQRDLLLYNEMDYRRNETNAYSNHNLMSPYNFNNGPSISTQSPAQPSSSPFSLGLDKLTLNITSNTNGSKSSNVLNTVGMKGNQRSIEHDYYAPQPKQTISSGPYSQYWQN